MTVASVSPAEALDQPGTESIEVVEARKIDLRGPDAITARFAFVGDPVESVGVRSRP